MLEGPQEDVFGLRRRGLEWQLVRESFWLLVNKSSSKEGLGNYWGSPGLVLSLSSQHRLGLISEPCGLPRRRRERERKKKNHIEPQKHMGRM